MRRKEHTTQFADSYCSIKCLGVGNGRKQSKVTSKLRREVNKKRRSLLKKNLLSEIRSIEEDGAE